MIKNGEGLVGRERGFLNEEGSVSREWEGLAGCEDVLGTRILSDKRGASGGKLWMRQGGAAGVDGQTSEEESGVGGFLEWEKRHLRTFASQQRRMHRAWI